MKYKSKLVFAEPGIGKTEFLRTFSPITQTRFFEYPLMYFTYFSDRQVDLAEIALKDFQDLIDAGVTVVTALSKLFIPKLSIFSDTEVMYYFQGSQERVNQCCEDLLKRGDEKAYNMRKSPEFFERLMNSVDQIKTLNLENVHLIGIPKGYYLSDYYDRETGEWSDEPLISL